MTSTGGTVTVRNSILGPVSGSTEAACAGSGFVSAGWNIVADTTCGFHQATDLANVHPVLNALAANGGPTKTMLPAATSPAIDSGDPGCSALDQRGRVRPADGNGDGSKICDRGAVEVGA